MEYTEQEKRYIDRPIEEESLSFEAFVNLENLRNKQESKLTPGKRHNIINHYSLQNGDPVRITVPVNDKDGKHNIELTGYVHDNSKSIYSPVVIVGDKLYDKYSQISKRLVVDYSNVVVREEIKKMPTKQLLSHYRFKRSEYGFSSSTNPVTGNYMDELKAELSIRENIETKYEKRLNKSK